MAKKKTPRSKPTIPQPVPQQAVAAESGFQPSWVSQPSAMSEAELLSSGFGSSFHITAEQLAAAKRLNAYLRSPATREHIAYDLKRGKFFSPVLGFGYGTRIRKNRVSKQPCIVANVQHKAADTNNICDALRLDRIKAAIDVNIDVLPVGSVRTADWFDLTIPGAEDPQLTQFQEGMVECGVSIGPNGHTGTFGALVRKNTGGFYILSNNHVIAGVAAHVSGFGSHGLQAGEKIFHPGPADVVGSLRKQVGVLSGPIPMLNLSEGGTTQELNTVDAALAEVSPDEAANYRFRLMENGFNVLEQQPYREADFGNSVQVGTRVVKVGRTTGLTEGTIIGLSQNSPPIGYMVGPAPFQKKVAGIFQQVLVIRSDDPSPSRRFSNAGDSGSVVYVENGGRPKAIGLLFAGSGDGMLTYAIPMFRVFTALGLTKFWNDED